ncbi:unnamed protein product [Plasmodium vivax]|uniref:Uncharacterized protein n=6 Tax=Plasmodium vivax TaxID=5855 RepID=A5KE50_PLAVS|nr:hypothetical protein, conserved [Plasmodium vivax]KMZ81532.1 hypothetical protein PVIIG_03386 [Plasmodium vivax India VII]KMZ87690.1 hypothetical protein PVBG_03791 [Plasmodium vivax Brazil I]KMZ94214.1 hypothetical protein PVMG_02440 [Plasmodium vivax Mauritania I]KNA00734.1 hypothetical protein PVNG_01600 [Plasmodium vivax North Korean]EDL42506.1 hypothetical protein, conserved [Plasmodium vivax]|eukprot:XP_001608530.1 hypothetical protein [Plasmodium vivax Sal-1]
MLKQVGDKTTQTEGNHEGSQDSSPPSSQSSGEDARGKDWFVVENIKLRKQIKSLKGEYEKANRNLSIRCQLLQHKQQIIPSNNFYLQLDKILRRRRKGRKYKNSATQTDITFVSPFFANWESYFEDSAVNRIASDGEVEVLKRKRITKRVSEIRYQRSGNQNAQQPASQRNIFKVPNHVIHKDNLLYSLYTDNDLIFIREITEDLIPKGGEKGDAGGVDHKGMGNPSPVGGSHQRDATEGRLSEGKGAKGTSSWVGKNPPEGEKLDDLLKHINQEEPPQVENNKSAAVLSQDEEGTNEGTVREGGHPPKGRSTHDEMDAVKRDTTSEAASTGALLPDEENKHGSAFRRSGGAERTEEHPAEADQATAKREKYIDVLLKHERGLPSPESSGTMLTPQEDTPHGGGPHSKVSPKWRAVPPSEEPMQRAKFVSSRRRKKEASTTWEMGVAKRAPIYLGGATTKPASTRNNATAPLCGSNVPSAQKNRKKKNRRSKQVRLCDSSPLPSEMETRMEPSMWNNPLRGEAQCTSDTPWVGKTSNRFVKSDAGSYSGRETCPPHGPAHKKGLLPPLWDAEEEGTSPLPTEGRHHSISLSDAEKSANEIRKIFLEHKKRAFLFYM